MSKAKATFETSITDAEDLLACTRGRHAHGYQRATTDIDLLVEASVANGEKVREALLVLADQSAREIDPAWFTQGDNIRVADEITVDLLFSPCAQTYEMLTPYEQIVDLDGVPVHTVSLAGLLLTKQTERPQDIQDALVLRRAIEVGG